MKAKDKDTKIILILGGFGFLGLNVMKFVDKYLCGQYCFIVLDRFNHPIKGITFNCIKKVYSGDFSNSKLLEQIFEENHIDIVLHSISTTIPVDCSNARYDVETNLIPTLGVLDLMVKHGVMNIIYLSSGGAIYGRQKSTLHRESNDVFPISSYGVVKLAIEKYLMQYAQIFDLRPLILRLSNPYGPYHYSMRQGVVNVAVAKALIGEPLEVWGDGDGGKDYIYVEDYARILFSLIDKNIHSEVINIASGQILTVNDIIKKIQEVIPTFYGEYKSAKTLDATNFSLDTTKLLQLLPDFQFTSFDLGLQKTMDWAFAVE